MTSFLISIANGLQIFGGTIAILSAAIIGFIEHKKLTPNKRTFAALTIVGGFMSLLGAHFSSVDSEIKTSTIIAQGEKIDSLSTLNAELSKGNSAKLDQNLAQLDTIIRKTKSVASNLEEESKKLSVLYEKTNQVQGYATGGNSFALVEILPIKDGFFFLNSGHSWEVSPPQPLCQNI